MKKSIQVPKELTRAGVMTEERSGEKTQKRITISTDTPYLRYDWMADEDYYEVLSHDAKDIDDSRLKLGLPVLFNHRRDFHLGRSTKYNNDGHRMDVGTLDDLIWSEGTDAQVKKKDVESGALVGTSVGYAITDDGVCIGAKDGIPIYKFKWAVHEFSFCTIEADTNCGAGRTREKAGAKDNPPELQTISVEVKNDIDDNSELSNNGPTKQNAMTKTPEQIAEENVKMSERIRVMEAENDKRQRCEKIDGFVKQSGEKHPDWAKRMEPIATKHKAGDADFESFRIEALDVHPALTRTDGQDRGIGMNEKEIKNFSLVRAIESIRVNNGRLDGYEKEVSDQVAKAAGRATSGFYIPQDVMIHRSEEELAKRYLAANVFTGAGAFIESSAQGQSLIELLRNNMMVMKMGARHLTGLKGNLAIPSQTGGATAAWLSEDATITNSQQVVGQVALTPHRLTASTAFTFQLLAQSENVDVENFVRQDLMMVIAIAKDLAALAGTGVSGQPLGISNTANLSTSVTLAGANSMTYANAVQFETNVATSNALLNRLGYLASIATRGNSKLVAEIAAANSIPVWKNDAVNGYPAFATTQLTVLPSVVFGNWDDLMIADWGPGGNEVIVDPYSLSMQGQVRVVIQQLTDVAIRHAKSFSISTT